MSNDTLENLLARGAALPAAVPSSPRRPSRRRELYDEAAADRLGFWAEQARAADLGHALRPDPRLDDAAVREVVRRRRAQRRLQLRRPARRGRQRRPRRHPLRGRARRHPHHHLRRAAARGQPGRQRADRPGVRQGRPRRHLPADDPRGRRSRCWRAPGSARRTPSSSAASPPTRCAPASTTPRPSSSSPPTAATAAASPPRSSPPSTRRVGQGAHASQNVLVVRRTGQDVDWNDGRDVWWHDAVEAASDRARRREAFDAEHPLFILYTSGTTGKPKGILHTTGGYLTQARLHPHGRLRPAPRDRRLLVHRRRRLGHRPLLHRLRPARQRRHPGHVRGHPRHPAPGPLVGDHREVQGLASSTPPPPRSAPS